MKNPIDEQQFFLRLRKEIDRWEEEQLLPTDALQTLRNRYGFHQSTSDSPAKLAPQHPSRIPPPNNTHHASSSSIRWILYLAVIAFLAAFFSFASSNATSLGPSLRVGILLLGALFSLAIGARLHGRLRIESIAFFVLGGLLLPITFYFTLHHYQLLQPEAPFLWWAALGLTIALVYFWLTHLFQEEGLAIVALLSTLSVPFMFTAHLLGNATHYTILCVALVLLIQLLQSFLPPSLQLSYKRPLWLLAQLLALTTLLLPTFARLFHTYPITIAYLLVTISLFSQARHSAQPLALAPFLLSLLFCVGSFLQASHVSIGYFPLIQLAVTLALSLLGFFLLQDRDKQLDVLLSTYSIIVFSSTLTLWFFQPKHFPHSLLQISIGAYAVGAVLLYLLAWKSRHGRAQLSYLGAWHIMASVMLAFPPNHIPMEALSLPLGALFFANALFFVSKEQQKASSYLAFMVLALPSLILSNTDHGFTRTALLSLGSIALIAFGAFRDRAHLLQIGILVLIPAVIIKLFPGLSSLGVPRFVWFALFGVLLASIVWILQRRNLTSNQTQPAHKESPDVPDPYPTNE